MKITNINAHKILDSRGKWTIKVFIQLKDGSFGTASVPQGKSKGSLEAHYLNPEEAIANIQKIINPALKDKETENQQKIDQMLLELDQTENKSKLGANAILGVSFAFAKAQAKSENMPLWQYFSQLTNEKISLQAPKLMVNMINGGAHAGNHLDFQEYLIIPQTQDIQESIKISTIFYHQLKNFLQEEIGPEAINIGDEGGFAPNLNNNLEPFKIFTEVAQDINASNNLLFGIDVAANNFKYLKEKITETYQKIIQKFPFYSIEDPFKEDEFKNFAELTQKVGDEVTIIGDDLTVTNINQIQKAHKQKSINGVIIKPNQIGTLTETIEAIKQAKKYNWKIVVSHRSGETNDDFIADLAWGVNADVFKLGAPARGERIAKYNRLLEINREIR